MIADTPIRPWHRDYWNVVAMCRWLIEDHQFTTEQIQSVYEKPWKWTREWGQFCVEQEMTVDQD